MIALTSRKIDLIIHMLSYDKTLALILCEMIKNHESK